MVRILATSVSISCSPEKHEFLDTHIKYVTMICKVSILRRQGVQVEGVQGERVRILSTSVSISI